MDLRLWLVPAVRWTGTSASEAAGDSLPRLQSYQRPLSNHNVFESCSQTSNGWLMARMTVLTSSSDHIRDALPSSSTANYNYPFAAAPDIIRSNQKDTYFQGVLHEQLTSILRRLYGARFIHKYNSETHTFTELLYLGLTTLLGNRTLGEEYCDIIQISDDSLRLPAISSRAGYIFSAVLLPYTLAKILPRFRNRIRLKLESNLRRSSKSSPYSFSKRLQSYILTNLLTITSTSPIYALTLSVFFFTGSYYHLSKRFCGLRYIFTKRLPPSDQRVGYEVLGVLLVLQMVVQAWLHVHSSLRSAAPIALDAGGIGGASAMVEGVEVGLGNQAYTVNSAALSANKQPPGTSKSRIEATTHTPVLDDKPRYDLKNADLMGWVNGRQQRKCTLCLEEMKDPSVTTCGHVFCWTCIGDWVKEKPECPLCRQGVLGQHILPLRG